jgi:uncharacterized protein YcbK (DUF882 family)
MSKVIKKGYMDNHMYGNFKWEEFFRTKATDKNGCKLDAINYPDEGEEADQVYANVRHLVRYYLQPLRDKLDTPLIINSGYRCRQVNQAVGGAPDSMHLRGCAADIRMPSVLVMCQAVAFFHERFEKLGIAYHELLPSRSRSGGLWLHLSFNPDTLKSAMRCRMIQY